MLSDTGRKESMPANGRVRHLRRWLVEGPRQKLLHSSLHAATFPQQGCLVYHNSLPAPIPCRFLRLPSPTLPYTNVDIFGTAVRHDRNFRDTHTSVAPEQPCLPAAQTMRSTHSSRPWTATQALRAFQTSARQSHAAVETPAARTSSRIRAPSTAWSGRFIMLPA